MGSGEIYSTKTFSRVPYQAKWIPGANKFKPQKTASNKKQTPKWTYSISPVDVSLHYEKMVTSKSLG